jgi:hypothetical protein
MALDGKKPEPLDLSRYHQNRCNYPPEKLLPYAGQHVAWGPDGTRILASGEDIDAVVRKLREAGVEPNQVVLDYIDPPDLVML